MTLQLSRLLTINRISRGGGVFPEESVLLLVTQGVLSILCILYVSYVIRCRIGNSVIVGSQDE